MRKHVGVVVTKHFAFIEYIIFCLKAATKTEQATFDKAQLRVKELLQQLEAAKRTADSARAKVCYLPSTLLPVILCRWTVK